MTAALPIALTALAVGGMLWADVAWPERLSGVAPFLKLVAIPILFIQFSRAGGGELMLVDLPGYGYAEASKTAVARWTGSVRRYLRSRAVLRRVCLLVDARHGLKETDQPILQMLDQTGTSYQIVLTKTDKLRSAELTAHAA